MKFTFKSKLVLILVIFWSIVLTLLIARAETSSNIKEGRIFIDNPGNNGSFFISLATTQNEIISPVMRADFPFNALFASWEFNSDKASPDMYVRFLNENWSEWQKIEIDDGTGKDGSQPSLFSQLISTKLTDTFQYKISFADNDARKSLNNLNFTYLDTTKGPSGNFKASLDQNNLQIVARKNWGADESYRFDPIGTPLWQEEYYTPKRFIIHHTAGEDANLNVESTIRAIYYWHAKVKGWGDVGYNYLIDSRGNIYEGRNGGDGVVGGHAFMNNRNSIGIAILGCYEDKNGKKNSTCNTPDNLTDAAKNSLNKLIAEKSREFNIDPMGQSEYQGKMMPNILGHRDVGQTTCPGSILYNLLPQIRQFSYNLLQSEGGYIKPLPTSAEFIKQSAKEINVEETKTSEVFAEFKNTGQEIWRGYEDNYVYVTDEQVKNKLARIDSVKMAMEGDGKDNATANSLMAYKLIGGNIYPGQVGQFKLVLNSPQATQKEIKNFVLAWSDKGYFPNTEFSIAVNKVPCTSCNQTISQNPLINAELNNLVLNERFGANENQEVKIQYKNIGSSAWLSDKLKLIVKNTKEELSFSSKEIVSPNATANFIFTLKSAANPGEYAYDFSLIYDGQEIYKFSKTIKVISPYSAEITANTIPDSMVRNTRKAVTLTFKNTGTKTWKNIVLKSYDIDGTNSWFKDWSWINSKAVKQIKKDVKVGEEITITFKIQAYWKANTYPQVFKLFDGKTQIDIGNAKELNISTKVTKK
jgi:hypothetical protein